VRFAFRTKLLAGYLALVAVAEVVTVAMLDRSLGDDLVRQLDARLLDQARGSVEWVNAGRHPDHLAVRLAMVVAAQVTIFDRAGQVVGDSTKGEVPRSLPDGEPPEVTGARRTGLGKATRFSTTQGEEMHYLALPASDGNVVRLGVPLAGNKATLALMRRRLLVASALAFAAAVALGLLVASRVVRPLREMTAAASHIAQGHYEVALPDPTPDEFGTLSRSLASLAAELKAKIGKLRRLETVRRDFVANVSHQLRTPVTAVQGYAETLLRGTADPATAAGFLEVIHRQSRRMGRLVEDLLTLSEVEALPPELAVRERVSIAEAVRHVAQTVRERAEAAGVAVRNEVSETVSALADPHGVEQLLENLVDNAIKYGRRGGSVWVKASRGEGRIRIEVVDDGPGIPAEHLPRIFERFYRGAADSRTEGTGLGLAIVRHVAESMSGTVSVENMEKGCRFVVELSEAPPQTDAASPLRRSG
jgi:two-component system phosphate regulon sensor histidine kinase PhoR